MSSSYITIPYSSFSCLLGPSKGCQRHNCENVRRLELQSIVLVGCEGLVVLGFLGS